MNKEVIYLEPEDDITDILTKLQQAEQKLVALVPPKKATMLRSAVNMKLVARVAKECEKVAVIVTADPAIVKMAMAAKIPVAKTLQSRPVIPTEASIKEAEAADALDEDLEDVEESADQLKKDAKTLSEASSSPSDAQSKKSADTIDLTEDSLENPSKDAKNDKKSAKKALKATKNHSGNPMDKYRKWLLFGIPALLILAVVLVWAFVFAPAVTITVAISSTPSNFSENIRFTTDAAAENIAEGIFFADKQISDATYKTDFKATGEENRGERAKGTLNVTYTLKLHDYVNNGGFSIGVPKGAIFSTADGLQYRATEASAPLTWNGTEFPVACNTPISSTNGTCVKTFSVFVEAVNAGENYNLASAVTWKSYEGASVTNSGAISDGTTKNVKVVSQTDVDEVKEAQISEHTVEGKADLLEDIDEALIPIESSFAAEASEVKSTPAVGDEVGENTTPNVEVKVVYSVYAVERAKVEEYIKQKTTLSEDQKIYSIGKPYFERYTAIEEPARLKTVIEVGPTVTEEDILEKAKGRKTGEVQSLLRSINGVSSVEIRTSYFWVWSVPTDPSKVTVHLTVEDNK